MNKKEFISELEKELKRENFDFRRFDDHLQRYYKQIWWDTVDEYYDKIGNKFIRKKQKTYELYSLLVKKLKEK